MGHIEKRGSKLIIDIEKYPDLFEKYLTQKEERLSGQVIWLTGYSGAGKTTILLGVKKQLESLEKKVILLDSDVIRAGICSDLGFSDEDRNENISSIGELAKFLAGNGVIVLCAFISPFAEKRAFVRSLLGSNNFKEVYVYCSLEECEKRDVKGLYKKFRDGKITHFTGFTSPYEPPVNPDLILYTADSSIEECVEKVINLIKKV